MKIRQSEPVFCSQEISSWRRKSCKQFPAGGIASCEEILRTCDTSSATCNVFQSSLLRDKLQQKLPRVTWPYETKLAREIKGHFLLNEHDDLYFFLHNLDEIIIFFELNEL